MSNESRRTVLYVLDSTNLTPLNDTVHAGNISHILVSLLHLGYNDEENKTGPYIHLNDDVLCDEQAVWKQVPAWQKAGVKVLGSMGGADVGDFNNLFSAYSLFYPILKNAIQTYNLDGLDLDIEESNPAVNTANVEKLVNDLRSDFSNREGGFIVSSAPVASALTSTNSVSPNVNYNDLLSIFDFYNLQFYGWGDLSGNGDPSTPNYDTIINTVGQGNVKKMVAGTLTNPSDGNGFLPTNTVTALTSKLVKSYPDFGGIMGWHYSNALNSANQVDPAGWCAAISAAQS